MLNCTSLCLACDIFLSGATLWLFWSYSCVYICALWVWAFIFMYLCKIGIAYSSSWPLRQKGASRSEAHTLTGCGIWGRVTTCVWSVSRLLSLLDRNTVLEMENKTTKTGRCGKKYFKTKYALKCSSNLSLNRRVNRLVCLFFLSKQNTRMRSIQLYYSDSPKPTP